MINVLVLFTIYFVKLYLKKILGQRKSKKCFRPIGSKNFPKNLRQKVIFGIQILWTFLTKTQGINNVELLHLKNIFSIILGKFLICHISLCRSFAFLDLLLSEICKIKFLLIIKFRITMFNNLEQQKISVENVEHQTFLGLNVYNVPTILFKTNVQWKCW